MQSTHHLLLEEAVTSRRPLPDSRARQEERFERTFSRWIFWGISALIVLLLLAVFFLA